MSAMYEYKVVPAPTRATKVKGLKTTADRFAHLLAERINAEAAGGWQFVRTETLACEERKGLGGTRNTMQTVMIFARELGQMRPDAGAALAAVQGGQAGWQDTDYDDRDAEAAYEDSVAYDDAQSLPDPATYHPAPEPEPVAAPAATRRQEPLFRSGAMLRGDGHGRTEPVLRPRAPQGDESEL